MTENDDVHNPVTASVVIITYQRPAHVRECLTHLAAQTYPLAETVVVDASPNSDTYGIVTQFPGVLYIRNPLGPGTMGASRDIGLHAVTGDVVVFFDDDAYADANCVREIATLFEDPTIGGVGGRASNGIDGEESEGVDRIGQFLADGSLTGYFGADPGKVIDVDHILGANMSWRREALLKIGGIRQLYPGTCLREDTDIALRIRDAGYRIVYNPRAIVRHVAGPYAKGKRFDRRYMYYAARNHLVLLLVNLGPNDSRFRNNLRHGLAQLRADLLIVTADLRNANLRRAAGQVSRVAATALGIGAGLARGFQARRFDRG